MKVVKWLGGALLVALTACNSNQKSFNNMTEEELYVYNRDKPLAEQVICEERRHSASRIRNSVCMTVQDMTEVRSHGFRKLRVLNHRTSFASANQARR